MLRASWLCLQAASACPADPLNRPTHPDPWPAFTSAAASNPSPPCPSSLPWSPQMGNPIMLMVKVRWEGGWLSAQIEQASMSQLYTGNNACIAKAAWSVACGSSSANLVPTLQPPLCSLSSGL